MLSMGFLKQTWVRSQKYGLSKSTTYNIIKNKDKIMSILNTNKLKQINCVQLIKTKMIKHCLGGSLSKDV